MSPRVLLAGLFHETHTFLEGTTPLSAWQVRRGAELLAAEGDGSPLGGAVRVGREHGWEFVSVIDLRATPSATVEDEVVETFWTEVSRAARDALSRGLDGVYLVLHGAMVSESHADVEGEILERLRGIPGMENVPICGVLDLHANATARMAKFGDALIAYRENPHIDAEAAAMDAARLLDRLMASTELASSPPLPTAGQGAVSAPPLPKGGPGGVGGHAGVALPRRPVTLFEQPHVVWPPTGVATADDPMRTLEKMARQIEREHPEILAVNVFAGFAFADTPDTGVSFSAVTVGDAGTARRELARLSAWAVEHRQLGNVCDPPIDDVMPRVLAHKEGPVLLVEPSDNIGGGAPGDGTGVLKALLKHNVPNAAVVINDPAAVAKCHAAAIGQKLRLSIGGKCCRPPLTSGPAELEVELLSKSNGRFELLDRHSHLASMCGVHVDMGNCAVVRHGGIRILLTTRKTPPFDLGQLTSQGIDPASLFVIGVKAAVAHRRAYDPIAKASYTVDTPGPCSSNVRSFPYQKIRRPVFPLDDIGAADVELA